MRLGICTGWAFGLALYAGNALAGMPSLVGYDHGRHADAHFIPVQGLSMDDLNAIAAGVETSPPAAPVSPSVGSPVSETAPAVVPFNPGTATGGFDAGVPSSKLPLSAPPPTTAAPSAISPAIEKMMGQQQSAPPPAADLQMPQMDLLPVDAELPPPEAAAFKGQQTIRPAAAAPQATTPPSASSRAAEAPIVAPAANKKNETKTSAPRSEVKKEQPARASATDTETRGEPDLVMSPAVPTQFDPTQAAMDGVVLTPEQIEAATGGKDVAMQPVRITPAPTQTGVNIRKEAEPATSAPRGNLKNIVTSDDVVRAKAAVPAVEAVDSQDAKDRHVHGKKKRGKEGKGKKKNTAMLSQPCSPPDLRLEALPKSAVHTYRLRGTLATPTEGWRYDVKPAAQRSSFIAPEGGPALMSMTLTMKRPEGAYHRANGKLKVDSEIRVAPATKRIDVVVNNVFGRRATVYYCRIPGSLD